MSDIVIMHRIPYGVTPLDEWIPEVADRVTLVTSEEAAPGYEGRFPRVVAVPGYDTGSRVECEVDELCRTGSVSTLVHVTEDDILRAAGIRDRFGLPGPRTDDVLPWRDKYRMKCHVAGAGVATAAFAVPSGPDEAAEFGERHGYPVVVKPRLGFASHGVRVVHDRDALVVELAGRDPDDVMIEQYVPGDMFHLDGFAQDGKVLHVSPSRYLNGCLAFQDGAPLGSVQLDRDDPSWDALADMAEQVVAALPPLDFCPYHLEIFRRPDGELVFCEIACRLGGGHIMEAFTRSTGVNPARLWIRHQLGLDDGPAVPVPSTGRLHGWLLVPPRTGRLVEIREPEGVAHLTDFVVKTPVPREFDGAHGSTDSIVGCVVSGADAAEVEANLHACVALVDRSTRWEET